MALEKILMFVDHVYEDMELWYPKYRLIEAGYAVVLAGPEAGQIYKGKHGYPCKSDIAIEDISSKDFAGLVIPGGFAPDQLRRNQKVLNVTKEIFDANKLIAHICHAGWIPISAGIVKGFTCTSTPGIKDDLINAGAQWVDRPLVVDRQMVSSRKPDDLPEFCKGILQVLAQNKG